MSAGKESCSNTAKVGYWENKYKMESRGRRKERKTEINK
jgi:hypothetical protein